MRHASLVVGLVLATLYQTALAEDFTVGHLTISQPYSLEVPPVSTTGAVFLTIANKGSHGDRLVGVHSPVSEQSQIHTMTLDQGVMKMRQLDGLDLPPEHSVSLQPGGHHIMLVGLQRPLVAGEEFPLTLVFDDAGPVQVVVTVNARGSAPETGKESHSGHDAGHGMHKHGHGVTK